MKKARNGFMNTLPYLCLVGVIVLGLMTIIGTGGGGGGGGGAPPSPTTCENVAGTWNLTEDVDATGCDEGTWTQYNTYTVTQNGCNITVEPSTGGSYSGTVNGNQISWTGSYPDQGGIVTSHVNLTISGDDVDGLDNWTWTEIDGTDPCSGTTQISGTRTTGGGGGGGGGGGTGVSLADLAGTWYGVQEDDIGDWHTISVTIDGSGNMTQILIDGANTGVTATITKVSDQIFSFLDSEGTEGGFFVDASAHHAGFVDEDSYFGVVEKGASSLPTYAHTDIVGTWSGYGIAFDSNGDIAAEWTSSATVLNDYSFSGSNSIPVNFDGSFPTFSSNYGWYAGTFSNNQGGAGPIKGFLSPDKSFAASYAIDTNGGGSFPEDFSFECWNRQ